MSVKLLFIYTQIPLKFTQLIDSYNRPVSGKRLRSVFLNTMYIQFIKYTYWKRPTSLKEITSKLYHDNAFLMSDIWQPHRKATQSIQLMQMVFLFHLFVLLRGGPQGGCPIKRKLYLPYTDVTRTFFSLNSKSRKGFIFRFSLIIV